MSLDHAKRRAVDAVKPGGKLVPVLWFLAAYVAAVLLMLWLGQVFDSPDISERGWFD